MMKIKKEVNEMDRNELCELGFTIRRLRTERNMTLVQVSDLTGIQPATLSRMENNKMIGTLDSYNALSEAFRMKLSELFQECEKDRLEAFEADLMELLRSESQNTF